MAHHIPSQRQPEDKFGSFDMPQAAYERLLDTARATQDQDRPPRWTTLAVVRTRLAMAIFRFRPLEILDREDGLLPEFPDVAGAYWTSGYLLKEPPTNKKNHGDRTTSSDTLDGSILHVKRSKRVGLLGHRVLECTVWPAADVEPKLIRKVRPQDS